MSLNFDYKPGTQGAPADVKLGWTLEDEIAWSESYLAQHQETLKKLYADRAWWQRFLNYCNTGR